MLVLASLPSSLGARTHAHPECCCPSLRPHEGKTESLLNSFPKTVDVHGMTPRQALAKKGKEDRPSGVLVPKIFFACGNHVNAEGLAGRLPDGSWSCIS